MQNAKQAYLQRKALKVAKKQSEREAFKARQESEARNELEKNTRKPEDVEIDLDAASSCLGSLKHQLDVVEYEMKVQSQEYSKLLMEYHKSKEVWEKEKPAGIQSEGISAAEVFPEVNDVQPQT